MIEPQHVAVNYKTMKTQEFFNLLANHKEHFLHFQYQPGKWVGNHYHITEVKHIQVDSVDCGSGTDQWNETIIQLWESPLEKGKSKPMSVLKALGILQKVGQMKPYDESAIIKFEYGNDTFHASQLPVESYTIQDNKLIVNLTTQPTDCKAKDTCGVPVEDEILEAACAPGSGCC